MSIQSLLTALLILSSLLTTALGIYALVYQRSTPYAAAFSLLMASITVYCFGYAMEISSGTLPRILFWIHIEYAGVSTLPAFWIILALQYANREERLSPKIVIPLLSLSAAIFFIHLTNDLHHLYYRGTTLDSDGPFPVIVIDRGPWYFVQVTYALLSFVLGAVLFFRMWRVSAASAKPQAAAMFIGSLCPGVSSVLYLAGLSPFGMDSVPLGMVFTGLMCALGLFRFGFLDVVPVAVNAVFRDMRDGVVILDRNGRVAEFNESADVALRDTQALRIGQPPDDGLAFGPDPGLRPDEGLGGGADTTLEVNGESRRFDLRRSPVRDARGRVVGTTIVLVDITDRVRLLEEMRMLAVTDELTGLCNRRRFMEHARIEMERARRTGRPVSAIAMDLDHFKSVNDTYGHAAGDLVLKEASATWKTLLRPVDILGRCGGEEFGILLPDTSVETAVSVAERLREAIGRLEVGVDGRTLRVTASFGVACFREAEDIVPDGLLNRADTALYAAKSGGRNKVMMDEGR